MRNISYQTIKTPIGLLEISATNEAIVTVKPTKIEKELTSSAASSKLVEKCAKELEEYFAGQRQQFDIPLNPEGTDFQKRVWRTLEKIPYGEIRIYGEIAQMMDKPKAARAIGMANHNNPILILTPCHRVVGADGSLTGYAAGIENKKYLLELEKMNVGQFH
ncbi:methylated-DNA--[protein]-cysteine S-methyltransferase [uncultured Lactobacillus sp.]|uniref:methylated-DNA--[protein]-cysteine S-methyltransferase n=1 Tax=uncultured Lactobacillus sp. TaxID=153152 RepID=UPI002637604A|nr:methylated-DNA--[protein]-cysteine S-methyltransferase [uncultured Lactobacillus sp.]